LIRLSDKKQVPARAPSSQSRATPHRFSRISLSSRWSSTPVVWFLCQSRCTHVRFNAVQCNKKGCASSSCVIVAPHPAPDPSTTLIRTIPVQSLRRLAAAFHARSRAFGRRRGPRRSCTRSRRGRTSGALHRCHEPQPIVPVSPRPHSHGHPTPPVNSSGMVAPKWRARQGDGLKTKKTTPDYHDKRGVWLHISPSTRA